MAQTSRQCVMWLEHEDEGQQLLNLLHPICLLLSNHVVDSHDLEQPSIFACNGCCSGNATTRAASTPIISVIKAAVTSSARPQHMQSGTRQSMEATKHKLQHAVLG